MQAALRNSGFIQIRRIDAWRLSSETPPEAKTETGRFANIKINTNLPRETSSKIDNETERKKKQTQTQKLKEIQRQRSTLPETDRSRQKQDKQTKTERHSEQNIKRGRHRLKKDFAALSTCTENLACKRNSNIFSLKAVSEGSRFEILG